MNTIFSIISDIMLWLSLPILGGLGYWEANLPLAENGHRLLLFLILVIVFTWIRFWYSAGENERLRNLKREQSCFPFQTRLLDGGQKKYIDSAGEEISYSFTNFDSDQTQIIEEETNVSCH